jgi:hypothetical protein
MLRHSPGIDTKLISEMLDHSSRAITEDIYTNSRELHQTGENPQVVWSQRWRSQFRGLGVLAA